MSRCEAGATEVTVAVRVRWRAIFLAALGLRGRRDGGERHRRARHRGRGRGAVTRGGAVRRGAARAGPAGGPTLGRLRENGEETTSWARHGGPRRTVPGRRRATGGRCGSGRALGRGRARRAGGADPARRAARRRPVRAAAVRGAAADRGSCSIPACSPGASARRRSSRCWCSWSGSPGPSSSLCVIVEVYAGVRRVGMPARVPFAGGTQALANRLVSAVLLLFAVSTVAGPIVGSGVGRAAPPRGRRHRRDRPGGARRAPSRLRPPLGVRKVKKVYVVQPPEGRHHESLWEIAEKCLGDGRRYPEIFRLNRDKVQPDGSRLRMADLIRPGWVLEMPDDAVNVHVVPADQEPAETLRDHPGRPAEGDGRTNHVEPGGRPRHGPGGARRRGREGGSGGDGTAGARDAAAGRGSAGRQGEAARTTGRARGRPATGPRRGQAGEAGPAADAEGRHEDAATPRAAAREPWPDLLDYLATGSLVAAGVLAALGRRRREQLWHRAFGHRIPRPQGDAADAEVALRLGSDAPGSRLLDLGLRLLGRRSPRRAAPRPRSTPPTCPATASTCGSTRPSRTPRSRGPRTTTARCGGSPPTRAGGWTSRRSPTSPRRTRGWSPRHRRHRPGDGGPRGRLRADLGDRGVHHRGARRARRRARHQPLVRRHAHHPGRLRRGAHRDRAGPGAARGIARRGAARAGGPGGPPAGARRRAHRARRRQRDRPGPAAALPAVRAAAGRRPGAAARHARPRRHPHRRPGTWCAGGVPYAAWTWAIDEDRVPGGRPRPGGRAPSRCPAATTTRSSSCSVRRRGTGRADLRRRTSRRSRPGRPSIQVRTRVRSRSSRRVSARGGPRSASCSEMLVYLATHPGGVHPVVLGGILWPRGVQSGGAGRHVRAGRRLARHRHHRPPAPVHRRPGRLRLGPEVQTDWQMFVGAHPAPAATAPTRPRCWSRRSTWCAARCSPTARRAGTPGSPPTTSSTT